MKWSFVPAHENKPWFWLALDRHSQEIVGVARGDRSSQTAQQSRGRLTIEGGVYRQCAVSYTDFWSAYSSIFPTFCHRTLGKKESGQTNPIERFSCTLRPRISRLVRKTLSFSKTTSNPIGAIWYFVHHYNASLGT